MTEIGVRKMIRTRPRKVAFQVSFLLPEGATVRDARNYVHDAISEWKGSLRPPRSYNPNDEGDPFFSLDRDSIRVTRVYSAAARNHSSKNK